jgi:hypothetical protein
MSAQPPMNKTINDQITVQFNEEVAEAKLLLEFAVAQGYTTEDGRTVDNNLIKAIKDAEDLVLKGEFPPSEQRTDFEKAYRDLSLLLAPVTAKTLRATSPEYGRRSFVVAWWPVAEATIWSRKLTLWTILFIMVALAWELFDKMLGQFNPPIDEAMDKNLIWVYFKTSLEILVPFTYGGLGACAFLLRSCHTYIRKRQFDPVRIPEYYNRILLGVVSGGAIALFVTEVGTDEGEAIRLGASALGFLTGYNTEFLFATLERVAAAILPKVGVETIRRAESPKTPALSVSLGDESLKGLLERYEKTTGKEERKLYQGLIERIRDRL